MNFINDMTKEYNKYLLSIEWANVRIELFNSRGKKCEKCSSKKRIEVHHLTYENIFHEEPKDLIILCNECHKKEHPNNSKNKFKVKTKIKKRINVTKVGNRISKTSERKLIRALKSGKNVKWKYLN